MTEVNDGAEGRPGCLIGRLLGAVARLVLVYPLVCIGSEVGQSAQSAVWPEMGTPFEGALAGGIAGLAIGISLLVRSRGPDGWRPRLADATLATVTLIWLAALLAGWAGRFTAEDALVPWIACVVGSGAIALVLRA